MIELRAAVPADALAVARVHVRAWQEGYRGLMPAAYLDSLRPEDRAARYTFDRPDGPHTTVALLDDTIVGFATTRTAELAALNVDPSAWGTGVGRALIARARASLLAAGATRAHLWLLAGNTRAARFYSLDGWTTDDTRRTETIWGITVDEIQYQREL